MTALNANTFSAPNRNAPSRGTACRRLTTVDCNDLLGRVIDATGRPIDGLGVICDLNHPQEVPRLQAAILGPFTTGVRMIDGLLTCAVGQRIAILADLEAYKLFLLAWFANHSSAEVVVIALIGASARDARHFIETKLGPEGLARCVAVVSTADDLPSTRAQAARLAAAVAQGYCDQGRGVLLLLDSLNGLFDQEPDQSRLEALLPCAGTHSSGSGSVTVFYTIDLDSSAAKGIANALARVSDGHIRLDSRRAECGYFPPIDLLRSNSSSCGHIVDREHRDAASLVRKLIVDYEAIEERLNTCAYMPGASREADLAVKTRQAVLKYLQQSPQKPSDLAGARQGLLALQQEIERARSALVEARQPSVADDSARILRPIQWPGSERRALAG